MDPLTLNSIDDLLTSRAFGYKDRKDYHYKAACAHQIPNIRVPTLFMNALDDPIIDESVIDFEACKNNENVILATSRHGGHVGYFESFFTDK